VNQLKTTHSPLLTTHSLVHRPWGTYETLIDDNGYKIKRIVVKPGKRLSLQKHLHRNEHWIVVSGTATVTVGDKVEIIRPNESTYIKMGEIHRLENQGKIPVVLIEAQVGEYTGEDDIVRIEDDFKRLYK
jgi:mannose-1-phosphate guanylyltransferase